jgi:hypothetical protein
MVLVLWVSVFSLVACISDRNGITGIRMFFLLPSSEIILELVRKTGNHIYGPIRVARTSLIAGDVKETRAYIWMGSIPLGQVRVIP